MIFIGYANNLTSFLIYMFGFKYNFRLWNFSQTCIIFGVLWLRKLREVKKCSMLMYCRQNPLYPSIQILNLGTFSYELNMVRLGHWHRRYHCMLCFACPSSFCLGFIWPPKNMVPSSVHSHLIWDTQQIHSLLLIIPLHFFPSNYWIRKDWGSKASQQYASQASFPSLTCLLSPPRCFLLLPLSYQDISLCSRLQ